MLETLLMATSVLVALFLFNTAFGILINWILKARRKKEPST